LFGGRDGAAAVAAGGADTVQPAELRVLLVALAGTAGAPGEWRGAAARPYPGRGWRRSCVLGSLVVVAQRDFGPALIFGTSAIGMLYVATRRRDYLVVALLGVVALGLLAYFGSARIQGRVETWADPWGDPRGAGYQSLQAIGGLVFGGVFGAGPYNRDQPAAHGLPARPIGEDGDRLPS
jgi:cell division protein FtsW (lipid II flippase)